MPVDLGIVDSDQERRNRRRNRKKRNGELTYSGKGDYINTMKTTFDFNFYSYQAVKQHECTYKEKSREVVN